MRYTLDERQCQNLTVSKGREWLLTNGIGGFAMGTPCGANTRRYHGLLVAATNPPATRYVLLANVDAFVQTSGGSAVGISCNQYPGAIFPEGYLYLRRFEAGPEAVWEYKVGRVELLKSLRMARGSNAVTLAYTNTGVTTFRLTLRPLVSHKFYHGNFYEHEGYPEDLNFGADSTLVKHQDITLVLSHPGAGRSPQRAWYYRFEHEEELARGLDSRDDLYCPCELTYELAPGETAVLVASVGTGAEPLQAPEGDKSITDIGEMLRAACAPYVVQGPNRRSIIAGYPWFTDWGRDTMISLPGLLLHTERVAEARQLLLDYGNHLQDGLIPNRFDEGGGADYNTVDATLWFANAIYKTLQVEWDEPFAKSAFEMLKEVFGCHMRGTLFGIGVDPADGLLRQGEPGTQLTWMDAKIREWVVTPRHGKPVEINALWINAVRVTEWLAQRLGQDAQVFTDAAGKAESCFDQRFWHEARGHYADTVDPLDVSLRPNQVIAMALPFAPAKGEHALRALQRVQAELLTPFGLRTLAPDEPGYCGRFKGPLPQLDNAYHQGTVWPWLLGPYVSALVKLTGDCKEARRILKNAKPMLMECGLGGISEVYDGDEPQTPGGCPWQAWSVAEMHRAWVEDVMGQ